MYGSYRGRQDNFSDERFTEDLGLLRAILTKVLKDRSDCGCPRLEKLRNLPLIKEAAHDVPRLIDELEILIKHMELDEIIPAVKALSLDLTLINTAEGHHRLRKTKGKEIAPGTKPAPGSLGGILNSMIESGFTPEELHEALGNQKVEIVITAHPTKVVRKTLTQKYKRIESLLAQRDRDDLLFRDREELVESLKREIVSTWETEEVRLKKLTPLDEAGVGLDLMEEILWDAVPEFARSLSRTLKKTTGKPLPLESTPILFGSWIGGDRDGNPNITPEVTKQVVFETRRLSALLYSREIHLLRQELSINAASPELIERTGSDQEPYRVILKKVRDKLEKTHRYYDDLLKERSPLPGEIYIEREELLEPLLLCYRSLQESGLEIIASGRLLDIIRRLYTFGLSLFKLDIRQEASRHGEALDAITRLLKLGNYLEWSEEKRIAFLVEKIKENQIRIPADCNFPDSEKETLETFHLLSRIPRNSLGTYIISTAQEASDILEVKFLQMVSHIKTELPIAPLFETSRDLKHAGAVMQKILSIPEYREPSGGVQEVMVGYSDSSKDVGKLASTWDLYCAQEEILKAIEHHNMKARLFHGRGGTISRGGGPTLMAIQSQPPGSVKGFLKVTEQGEMIQNKLGVPKIALRTLETYTIAALHATLTPPAPPSDECRKLISQMAEISGKSYRRQVRDNPEFTDYFQNTTPIRELSKLNISSRPAFRKGGGSIQKLRAIPWIFAWTQNRFLLPSWLGVGEAVETLIKEGKKEELDKMYQEWPFFRSFVDLLEMVLVKSDLNIARHYESRLNPKECMSPSCRALSESFEQEYLRTREQITAITGEESPFAQETPLKTSLEIRSSFLLALNLLQVELLCRLREIDDQESPEYEKHLLAFLKSVNGIAAGMRNTG